VTDDQLDKIAAWYRSEFKRRTEAIEAGGAKIDWLVPEYRVSRSEVVAYAESIGITMDANDSIQLIHYLNRKD
jgi:hypothetical protein